DPDSGDDAFVFEARVGERELTGCDFLRYDADGRIVELMVMVRPLGAAQELAARMAERFEEIQAGLARYHARDVRPCHRTRFPVTLVVRKERDMRAVVVYESMFGNTRTVAEAIAAGLSSSSVPTTVVSVFSKEDVDLHGVDLLVVGAPTHVHGMPSTRSRAAA